MRYLSAQYVFTNAGPPLNKPVICIEDDGTIISIENTFGKLTERHSVEFYNGVIVPGFVNCHCHLELSYLKGEIPERTGLSGFLMSVNSIRNTLVKDIGLSIMKADDEMFSEGVVLCADICNTQVSFSIKKKSRIKYINLLEVFGIDKEKAEKRMDEILALSAKAEEENLPAWIVPHAVYSMSLPLFRLLKFHTRHNKLSSIHFMESTDEKVFLAGHSGPLMESYRRFLPPLAEITTARDHISAILEEINEGGNLILVHNTFIEKEDIEKLRQRDNIFYCLCPNSNKYIEDKTAPSGLLTKENCELVIGTDSLSSNKKLSILEELKTLQNDLPSVTLETLIKWATFNGAKALGEEDWAGTIEPGKKPGLVLINNLDLINLRLLPATTARRIL
jgi:cytosine/adenosine deaminase-related metal-dependent hydrolase